MEFLAFECIRISRKWNVFAALEQWPLERVQSKCIMGCQGDCGLSRVWDSHSRTTPRMTLVIFFCCCFWKYISKYNVLLANSGKCVWILWPRRMGYLEFEPWFLPRLPAEFFSPRGFFPAGFFWPPSDSSSCVNCRSALSLVLSVYLGRSCIRL